MLRLVRWIRQIFQPQQIGLLFKRFSQNNRFMRKLIQSRYNGCRSPFKTQTTPPTSLITKYYNNITNLVCEE